MLPLANSKAVTAVTLASSCAAAAAGGRCEFAMQTVLVMQVCAREANSPHVSLHSQSKLVLVMQARTMRAHDESPCWRLLCELMLTMQAHASELMLQAHTRDATSHSRYKVSLAMQACAHRIAGNDLCNSCCLVTRPCWR